MSSLALMASAASVCGQGATTNQVRLELRLVSQIGTVGTAVASADVDTHIDQTSSLGVARRFEVQWRIIDLNISDTFIPAGLVSGNLRIAATGGTLTRALLSRNEAGGAGAPPVTTPANLDTDTSPVASNGATGLHRPFRGGIPAPAPNNDNAANGVFSADNTVLSGITPLVLSQSDQNDPTGGGWYGLYSFNFVPATIMGTVTVSMDADPTTGNRFGFFNDQDPVPVTSPVVIGDSANMGYPSPSTGLIVMMSCSVANRRRRTNG